jgi:hypothetical protein
MVMDSAAVKAMFTPVDAPADPYDPTLAVEGLNDFFEPRNAPETDPTLDVSSLGDFFEERETVEDDLSNVFEEPRPTLVLVSSREEREEPVNTPMQVELDEVSVPELFARPPSTRLRTRPPVFSAP